MAWIATNNKRFCLIQIIFTHSYCWQPKPTTTIGTIIVIIQIIGKIVLHYFGKPHVGKMLKWIESAPKQKPSPPHQPHLNSYQCIIIITGLTINNKSVLGAICWEERAEKFWQNWHFMSKQSSKAGQTMMMAMIMVVMMMTRSITCQVNRKSRMKEKKHFETTLPAISLSWTGALSVKQRGRSEKTAPFKSSER